MPGSRWSSPILETRRPQLRGGRVLRLWAMDPAARARRLAEARLYFVCDAGFSPVELEGLVAQALAGGADIVQLRDKHAPERALRAAASLFRDAAAERGALFILNDR